jgi:hypothetical protein
MSTEAAMTTRTIMQAHRQSKPVRLSFRAATAAILAFSAFVWWLALSILWRL